MKSKILCLSILVLAKTSIAEPVDKWRTLEIETSEVTAPDIAVSPDGSHLVFTLLGHLFLLPVEGGDARQLTFGPVQARDPAFSPDGARIAFVSNRDGSDGNVFLLTLQSGSVVQVTHDSEVARPVFSADGQSIAYLRMLERGHHCPGGLSELAVIRISDGASFDPSIPRGNIRSVFYLQGGRLAWSEHVRGTDEFHSGDVTAIRALSDENTIQTIKTIPGVSDRVAPHPIRQEFFIRSQLGGWQPEYLALARDSDEEPSIISSLTPQPCFYSSTSLAVSDDGSEVYVGDVGHLWKFSINERIREPIPFRARVRMKIRPSQTVVPLDAPNFDEPFPASSIESPVLSPNDNTLVFGAGGLLWRLDAGETRPTQLLGDDSYQRDPVFSPTGEELLFRWSDGHHQEIRVLHLETGLVETLDSGSDFWGASWSPDGKRIVYAASSPETPPHIVIREVATGDTKNLHLTGLDDWSARPQFSRDQKFLYIAMAPTGLPAVYRIDIDDPAKKIQVTPVDFGHAHRPALSPDGASLAFRHNSDIWLGNLKEGALVAGSLRRLSDEGADQFAYTADGGSIIYSVGNRIWRHDLDKEFPLEIPVELAFRYPEPGALLIQDVRLLNFATGAFTAPTTVFIEGGYIKSIGEISSSDLRGDVKRLDANGGFAIPGLFDMHGHIQRSFNGLWLAYGITSVRDLGGPLGWVAALGDRSNARIGELPSIFFSGDILHGVSSTRDPVMISNEGEARRYVRQWKARGVHFIKTHPGLTWGAQLAISDEASQFGLPVVEHATPLAYLYRAVTAGASFVEHTRGGFRYRDDVLQLLAMAGTKWTPTLAVTAAPAVAAIEDPEYWVDGKLHELASPADLNNMLAYGMSDDPRVLQGYSRQARLEIQSAIRRGVRYQAGTDAPAWLTIPGQSLHQELATFADAGMAPLDILRMATLDAATAVGAGNWLGSVDVGKVANIVLLEANPLEDIRNTRRVWRVIKNGSAVDPMSLHTSN